MPTHFTTIFVHIIVFIYALNKVHCNSEEIAEKRIEKRYYFNTDDDNNKIVLNMNKDDLIVHNNDDDDFKKEHFYSYKDFKDSYLQHEPHTKKRGKFILTKSKEQPQHEQFNDHYDEYKDHNDYWSHHDDQDYKDVNQHKHAMLEYIDYKNPAKTFRIEDDDFPQDEINCYDYNCYDCYCEGDYRNPYCEHCWDDCYEYDWDCYDDEYQPINIDIDTSASAEAGAEAIADVNSNSSSTVSITYNASSSNSGVNQLINLNNITTVNDPTQQNMMGVENHNFNNVTNIINTGGNNVSVLLPNIVIHINNTMSGGSGSDIGDAIGEVLVPLLDEVLVLLDGVLCGTACTLAKETCLVTQLNVCNIPVVDAACQLLANILCSQQFVVCAGNCSSIRKYEHFRK